MNKYELRAGITAKDRDLNHDPLVYPSYPLSRLRNGAYPGLAFLFSSRISPLKYLLSYLCWTIIEALSK